MEGVLNASRQVMEKVMSDSSLYLWSMGSGGAHTHATVRILMITYTMYIPLLSLQPETIGLLLSDDKWESIQDKLSWGDRYGTSSLIQGKKGEKAQPPPLYDPVLGRIEAVVNDDPENLILYGMEKTYDFILDHQIREFICLWYRADYASR